MLIYRKNLNQLEHFEPHGSKFIEGVTTNRSIYPRLINQFMSYIVNKINELNRSEHVFENDLTYINPMLSCPTYIKKSVGFQGLQEVEKDVPKNLMGTCMLWSYLIATLILENPEVSTINVQEFILQYASIIAAKTSQSFTVVMVKIIVGFAIYMVNMMDDYVKLLFIGSEFEDIGRSLEKGHELLYSKKDYKSFNLIKRHEDIINKKFISSYDVKSTGENIQELKDEIENNISSIDQELNILNSTLEGLKREMSSSKTNYQTLQPPRTFSGALLFQLGLSESNKKLKDHKKYLNLRETYDDLELKRVALNFGKQRLNHMLSIIEEAPLETSQKEAAVAAEPLTNVLDEPLTNVLDEPLTNVLDEPLTNAPTGPKPRKPREKKPPAKPLTPEEMNELERYLSKNPLLRQAFNMSTITAQKRKFYEDIKMAKKGGKRVTKRKRIVKRKTRKH